MIKEGMMDQNSHLYKGLIIPKEILALLIIAQCILFSISGILLFYAVKSDFVCYLFAVLFFALGLCGMQLMLKNLIQYKISDEGIFLSKKFFIKQDKFFSWEDIEAVYLLPLKQMIGAMTLSFPYLIMSTYDMDNTCLAELTSERTLTYITRKLYAQNVITVPYRGEIQQLIEEKTGMQAIKMS